MNDNKKITKIRIPFILLILLKKENTNKVKLKDIKNINPKIVVVFIKGLPENPPIVNITQKKINEIKMTKKIGFLNNFLNPLINI
ncbi:MAG: hypothetical protein P8Y70_18405 [Candidatus Lokiarchaeota archaeon]